MTYYYALTDKNGVLCVGQVGDDDSAAPTLEEVAGLARSYPDAIYFTVESSS